MKKLVMLLVLILPVGLVSALSFSITGVWQMQNTDFSITVNSNGSFYGSNGVAGKWSLEGNQITLVDSACGNSEGVYEIVGNSSAFTLTFLADPCAERQKNTSGATFLRQ